MKLKFSDRCEQGTPRGVMLFRKGGEYAVEPAADGTFVVHHEPREAVVRVDGKRTVTTVSSTTVEKRVLDKLVKFGPVVLEGAR